MSQNIIIIRLVAPVSVTEDQGDQAYYAALGAIKEALPDLTDDESDFISTESGWGLES